MYEKKKLNNNVAGTAGEYYVTAEMLRRGFIAATLYSCAKDYDILAYYPKTDKSLKIQVKTSQDKSLKWQIGNHEPVCDDNMFFEYIVPDGVKRIGVGCMPQDGIEMLTLPESVTEIGWDEYGLRGLIIKAPANSYAIQFAKEHDMEYIEI